MYLHGLRGNWQHTLLNFSLRFLTMTVYQWRKKKSYVHYFCLVGTRRLADTIPTSSPLQECSKLSVNRIFKSPSNRLAISSPATPTAFNRSPSGCSDERPDGVRREPVSGPRVERGAAAAPALRGHARCGRRHLSGSIARRSLCQVLAKSGRCR